MKLYVGNLPYSVQEDDLKEMFSGYEVSEAKVIADRDSGRSKGFGFVEIASDEDATRAIEELNGKEIDGRKIIVNEARPPKKREGGNNRSSFGNRRRFSSR